MVDKNLCIEILEELDKRKVKNQEDINKVKILVSRRHKGVRIPNNVELLSMISSENKELVQVLSIKPTRTISGVAVVAVMSKPFKCPHGVCIMCPGGPKSYFGDVPQSYTGNEPASRRAKRNHYDPYLQVMNRLEHYLCLHKVPDKIELIIMGGTFPAMPKDYQEEFVKYCFKAFNDFSSLFFKNEEVDYNKFNEFFELPGDINDIGRTNRIHEKFIALKNSNVADLEKEQLVNEDSKVRCIGMTVETKPDWGLLKHGNELLKLGCTRVEVGVQSLDDEILLRINRGHDLKDTIKSFQELKDLGFKINAHYMLGLPGSSKEKDLEDLKKLFSDERFKPDMLKIYPCLVVKGTGLYTLYKLGKFRPMSTKEAAEIISEFKRDVPIYLRIMRVQRDIPSNIISAGVDRTNLREYVKQLCFEKGISCRCIRCRESGRARKIEDVDVFVKEYMASDGREFFISFEDKENDVLVGFCRLRFPSKQLRKEFTEKTAIIRELHVYSSAVEIGKEAFENQFQHKGLGKKLVSKAEDIAKENGMDKMLVISGIGVKRYYEKLGYKKEGSYMGKSLRNL